MIGLLIEVVFWASRSIPIIGNILLILNHSVDVVDHIGNIDKT